jgi:hypothetical protein
MKKCRRTGREMAMSNVMMIVEMLGENAFVSRLFSSYHAISLD